MRTQELASLTFLEEKEILHEVRTFPTEIEKGASSVARALGFRERQMVKTLVFECASGKRLLVMVGGDQSIKSGLLKKAAGSRDIKLASPEIVIATTGYPIGSIPPFHWQPEGFRSFIDSSLMEEMQLGVGTGKWGIEILISPQNLVSASRAEVVLLCDPSADRLPS